MSQPPRLSRLWHSLPFRVALMAAALLALGVKLLVSSNGRRTGQRTATQLSAPVRQSQAVTAKTVTQGFSSPIARFNSPPSPPEPGQGAAPPPLPEDVRKALVSEPVPISLFSSTVPELAPVAPAPPTRYLPSFRLIRCMLITAPQTGEIETPLIGLVLENQCNVDAHGRSHVVIPAGTEVHAMGRPTPVRDRIDGDADWTFVWRTRDDDNATELTVPALALNRDYDDARGIYGDQEKSPGILGRRFESFSETVIKEALLDAAAATIRTLKSTTARTNPVSGGTSYEQNPGVRNAALEGAAAGTDRVTRMLDDIRQQIEQKGYYVAVLPGKEFYLYNKVPIDLRLSRHPGIAQAPGDTRRAPDPTPQDEPKS